MGHTQCTRCEKFCDQVKKIWGAFSEKENQLRFPKPCIVVRKTDVLVCKWMIDLNVFKGIKPDRTEVNLCKLIYVLGFSLGFHLGSENCWTFLLYVSEKSKLEYMHYLY